MPVRWFPEFGFRQAAMLDTYDVCHGPGLALELSKSIFAAEKGSGT